MYHVSRQIDSETKIRTSIWNKTNDCRMGQILHYNVLSVATNNIRQIFNMSGIISSTNTFTHKKNREVKYPRANV